MWSGRRRRERPARAGAKAGPTAGFTLIEVLVAVLIAAMMGGALVQYFSVIRLGAARVDDTLAAWEVARAVAAGVPQEGSSRRASPSAPREPMLGDSNSRRSPPSARRRCRFPTARHPRRAPNPTRPRRNGGRRIGFPSTSPARAAAGRSSRRCASAAKPGATCNERRPAPGSAAATAADAGRALGARRLLAGSRCWSRSG